MARIRTIKPEFCTSEQVGDCSTTSRLLFILMWLHVDDAGNHPAKLMQLRAECFPMDNFNRDDMQGFVDELLKAGLIVEYVGNDDAMYWHVTGWHHQKIEKPRFSCPPFSEESTTSRRTIDDKSPTSRLSTRPYRTGDDHTKPSTNTGSGEPAHTQTKTRKTKKTRAAYPPDFESFWKAYPRRNGAASGEKSEAYLAWIAMTDEDQQLATKALPNYIGNLGDRFPKDACRYLKHSIFMDHLEADPDRPLTEEEIQAELSRQVNQYFDRD